MGREAKRANRERKVETRKKRCGDRGRREKRERERERERERAGEAKRGEKRRRCMTTVRVRDRG